MIDDALLIDDSAFSDWVERTIDDADQIPSTYMDRTLVQVALSNCNPKPFLKLAKDWSWHFHHDGNGNPSFGTITKHRCLLVDGLIWSRWRDSVPSEEFPLIHENFIQIEIHTRFNYYYGLIDDYSKNYIEKLWKSGNTLQYRYLIDRNRGQSDLERFRSFFSSNPVM